MYGISVVFIPGVPSRSLHLLQEAFLISITDNWCINVLRFFSTSIASDWCTKMLKTNVFVLFVSYSCCFASDCFGIITFYLICFRSWVSII